MSYAQNTINNVDAANVLAGVLDTLLLDAGWTVVEELIPSGTFHTKVYLSAGTENQCGYDWYTVIRWNAVGTENYFEVLCGGAYNSTTHVLSQITDSDSGTGSTTGSASPYAETVTGAHCGPLNVNAAPTTSSSWSSHSNTINKGWFWCIVPSSAFGYWASVTLDHVWITTTIAPANGRATQAFCAYTLDVSADWLAQPYPVASNPVCSMGFTSGISVSVIGNGTTDAVHINPSVSGLNVTYGVTLPALSSIFYPAYAWRPTPYLSSLNYNNLDPLVSPGVRQQTIGQAIDIYAVKGGAIGDTVTIDGATYVLSGPYLSTTGNGGMQLAVLVED